MAGLSQAELRRLEQSVTVAILEALKEVREEFSSAFVRDVVPRTPVDTGHARRNWQVSWGAPTNNELPGVDKEGANTVDNGISRIITGRNRNAFLPVVIENNVPYIGRLNEGSSRQAPPMFIEESISRAILEAERARRTRRFI